MITVADVVAADELGLEVVAGHDLLDAEVVVAHVSELITPQPWLRGGELLMTVGLLLEMTVEACCGYLRNCRAGGVAAVALGLGPGLPYQRCPQPLRIAAQREGVVLLTVPAHVPFIAVTKWVFATKAEQERHDLEHAMLTNRRLTLVATRNAPLPALLEAWAEISSVPCVVCDGLGRLVAATPGSADAVIHEATAHAVALSADPAAPGWSVRGDLEIHTVGSPVTIGFIVLGAQMNPVARHSSTVLVALLALELERRNIAGQPERQRRLAVFTQLMRSGLTHARAQQLADSVGWGTALIQVAVIRPAPTELDALIFRLRVSLPAALIRVRRNDIEVAHPETDGLLDTLSRLAGDHPIGLGAAVAAHTLIASATQARSLIAVSERLRRPVSAHEGHTAQLLLGFGDQRVLRGFADAVLAPLDALDERERDELLRTLAEWLRANGAWDPAAARLSVHRNTVRNRMERIAALSGRRLDDGDDRMELWLALKARAATPRV
ncbi:MAG: PucR family transcriptional regulator [Gordonia sp. (in: high G+C Gram-positive bacteria)]